MSYIRSLSTPLLFSALLVFVLTPRQAFAEQTIIPVKDINTGSQDDRIYHACTFGGYNYYLISNGTVGTEFFAAPIGSEDLKLLVDSVPGPSGTFSVNWFFRCSKYYNGYTYLAARTGDNETTIYRTQGTPESTEVVGMIDHWVQIAPRAGKYLIYGNTTPGTGYEPWSFNLETGEKTFLGDLYEGSETSNPQFGSTSVETDGKIFFKAQAEGTGYELFVTDGTPEGTRLVKDIWPGSIGSHPGIFTGLRGKTYFTAQTESEGRELWVTDGTEAGTTLVRDFNSGAAQGARILWERDGFLYMRVETAEHGAELWISDGTADGSSLLLDIVPGPEGSFPIVYDEKINGNLLVGAKLDSGSQYLTLYQTDGTPGGTSKLLENFDAILNPYVPLAQAGPEVIFVGETEEHGRELWKTDGTDEGTIRLTDILPGSEDGVSTATEFEPFGNSAIFQGGSNQDLKHYKVALDTFAVADLGWQDPVASKGSSPTSFHSIGSKFLFSAHTPETGRELWISDGTESGTTLVQDTIPGSHSLLGSTSSFAQLGSYSYFVGTDEAHGSELWRTDGTASGTTLVKDIHPGPDGSMETIDNLFSVINGKLVFPANDGTHGREFWISDGTGAGTVLLKDIYSGSNSGLGNSRAWTVHNNLLFFSAQTPDTGYEVWTTDGTEGNTNLLKDIRAGSPDSHPRDFTVFQGKVYFSAYEPTYGTELWKTDGTEAGTELAEDIEPGPDGSRAAPLFATDSYLLLRVYKEDLGTEPWVKTSEAAASTLLKDTFPGNESNFIQIDRHSETLNSILLFIAEREDTGKEVWRTDGTSAGTYLLKDIRPGRSSSVTTLYPRVYNEKIYFAAINGVNGYELWYTDGTSSGTQLVVDLFPGRGAGVSNLKSFLRFNGKAFFAASDVVLGRELFTFGEDQCPSDPSKSYPGYCGCGFPDEDTDLDLVIECNAGCPNDPLKTLPGACGCGVFEADANANGVFDCLYAEDFNASLLALRKQISKLKAKRSYKSKKAKQKEKELKALIRQFLSRVIEAQSLSIGTLGLNTTQLKYNKLFKAARKNAKKALKNNSSSFGRNKKKAKKAIRKLMRLLP